jgi:hypothetical protein
MRQLELVRFLGDSAADELWPPAGGPLVVKQWPESRDYRGDDRRFPNTIRPEHGKKKAARAA